MNRREWLKRAGFGSIALASLPTIITMGVTPARAAEQMNLNFHFSAISEDTLDLPNVGGLVDRLIIAGSGRFSSSDVEGAGSFVHYDGALRGPDNIVAGFTGTWVATRFVSFQLAGIYGSLAAGVLIMEIDLVRLGAKVPSLLTLVSNLRPGGRQLDTGKLDGVTLVAPIQPLTFVFEPLPASVNEVLPVVFSTLVEQTD